MSLPTFTCRIAFDNDPFDTPALTWTDVSSDLISFNIKRGRQHQLDRFEAGTASVLLKNPDDNYWPNNTGGDYTPNVTIGKRINIRATWDATTYDLYTGFIRQWQPVWFSHDDLAHPGMQLTCADLQRNISRKRLNDETGYSQELSGTRVDNVLDDVGWNATERDIDAGNENMIASGALENVNAMEHLYSVQESELGNLWIKGNGYVRFEERGTRSAGIIATFGDGELPMFDPEFPLDDDLVRNEIILNRVGGTAQSITDAVSVAKYGPRTLQKDNLLLTTDEIVYVYCVYYLARFDNPVHRVRSFTLKPQVPDSTTQAALWVAALSYDIGTCIEIVLARAYLDDVYFIEGIEHNFDYRNGEFTSRWQLSNATNFYAGTSPQDAIIRPSAAGDKTEITVQFPATTSHYDKVDESVADDDTTYVEVVSGGTGNLRDLYNLGNPAYQNGVINSVKVYARCKQTSGGHSSGSDPRIVIKTEATEYQGAQVDCSAGWTLLGETYTLNPNTTAAWTWAEVNALQAGVELIDDAPAFTRRYRCTQVYVIVNYTPSW